MDEEYRWAAVKSRERINHLLALPATGEEQDWEMELLDPNRVSEMIDALEQIDLDLEDKSALALLSIASMEEAFFLGNFLQDDFDRMKTFLSHNNRIRSRMHSYWIEHKGARDMNFVQKLFGR